VLLGEGNGSVHSDILGDLCLDPAANFLNEFLTNLALLFENGLAHFFILLDGFLIDVCTFLSKGIVQFLETFEARLDLRLVKSFKLLSAGAFPGDGDLIGSLLHGLCLALLDPLFGGADELGELFAINLDVAHEVVSELEGGLLLDLLLALTVLLKLRSVLLGDFVESCIDLAAELFSFLLALRDRFEDGLDVSGADGRLVADHVSGLDGFAERVDLAQLFDAVLLRPPLEVLPLLRALSHARVPFLNPDVALLTVVGAELLHSLLPVGAATFSDGLKVSPGALEISDSHGDLTLDLEVPVSLLDLLDLTAGISGCPLDLALDIRGKDDGGEEGGNERFHVVCGEV